jgi:hypothetical protein
VSSERVKSEVSGGTWTRYGKTPRTISVPLFDRVRVSRSVAVPRAYVVPPQWKSALEVARAHGLVMRRLAAAWTGEVESYRLEEPRWKERPFEGRHTLEVKAVPVRERRTYAAGSWVIPLDQPAGRVAMHLFEPAAPDSLAAWGFFDAVLEQKEYGEAYVLEVLARKMLAADPALARELAARLAKDPKFAASPEARLDFFYRRSPYWDQNVGRYPVGRITGDPP